MALRAGLLENWWHFDKRLDIRSAAFERCSARWACATTPAPIMVELKSVCLAAHTKDGVFIVDEWDTYLANPTPALLISGIILALVSTAPSP